MVMSSTDTSLILLLNILTTKTPLTAILLCSASKEKLERWPRIDAELTALSLVDIGFKASACQSSLDFIKIAQGVSLGSTYFDVHRMRKGVACVNARH